MIVINILHGQRSVQGVPCFVQRLTHKGRQDRVDDQVDELRNDEDLDYPVQRVGAAVPKDALVKEQDGHADRHGHERVQPHGPDDALEPDRELPDCNFSQWLPHAGMEVDVDGHD